MALDQRIGNKIMKSQRREEAPGTRVDPYPYVGIVKNNLDPTRCGRLQVWIPDLGGKEEDPKNWRTVSYASPFMGTTDIARGAAKAPNTDNKFGNTPNTYGMWMVPPDIGVEILVLFIAGDPLRGYWFACVNSGLGRYMIPGVAGSNNLALDGASSDIKQTLQSGSIAPVTEFNENDPNLAQKPSFYTNPKPVHEVQYRLLKEQGLDRDTVRGVVSSSSQRESPSQVFGISTPGRPYPDNGADDPEAYLAKVQAGTLTEYDYAYSTRKGGHTFIMDDGNLIGTDQLVRLRTAKGHQIMMHDTENTLYLSHADGTSWLELTSGGAINVFSSAGFNLRSKGTINLHSDKDVNIDANNINMRSSNKIQFNSTKTNLLTGQLNVESTGVLEMLAGSGFNVQAGAKISVKAGGTIALEGSSILHNSGGTQTVKGVDPIQINNLPDTTRLTPTALWTSEPNLLSTIVTIAPTHEPFDRGEVSATSPVSDGIQPSKYTGTQDATKTTSGTSFSNPAIDKDLRNQPPCDCTLGNLTSNDLTAYFAQIGKSESGGKYDAVNSIGYVGKYQFGYPALIDAGYVKRSVRSNAQLNNPNSWTGKDGITSLDDWLSNSAVQESAMCEYTKRNYSTMCKIGAITSDQSPEDVAGMLAVSHLLGPGGAKNFRNGAGGSDAYGTSGATYFQKGKYAVAVLSPQVPAVNQG
jgi:hypothetical protein